MATTSKLAAGKQSEQSSQARPKRTRAKFPKVRTGCLTCKIRHKKCDEAKPTCQRCRDYGYKCDGYEQPQQPRCPKKKTQPKPASQAVVVTSPCVDLFNAFNNLGAMHGSPPERSLFLHVHQWTIKDLIGYSTSLSRFWRDYVLPISHEAAPVRHALVSLGASHKSFLLRRSAGMSPTETQSYDQLAIQQYNKAIADLTPLMGNPSSLDVQAILVCCLIFTCIDNLTGRRDVAMKHLRAGSDLLNSLREESPSPGSSPSEASTPSTQLTTTRHDTSALSDISGMFERLSLDTSILAEDLPVHRQAFPEHTTDDTHGQFLSSFAARDAMRRIDVDWAELRCHPDTEYCCKVEAGSRCPCFEPVNHAFREICDRYAVWAARFDQYLESINHTPASDGEFNEAMILTLHRKVFTAMLKQGPFFDGHLGRKEFEDIINQAELVIPLLSQGTHPLFTFEADTIPPVAFVASCCEDEDLRRRAIAMLRSMNRIEGPWDSQRMADMTELELSTGVCAATLPSAGMLDCQGLCDKARAECLALQHGTRSACGMSKCS